MSARSSFGQQHWGSILHCARKHGWKKVTVDGIEYACLLLAPTHKTLEPVEAVIAMGWPQRFDTKLGRYVY